MDFCIPQVEARLVYPLGLSQELREHIDSIVNADDSYESDFSGEEETPEDLVIMSWKNESESFLAILVEHGEDQFFEQDLRLEDISGEDELKAA